MSLCMFGSSTYVPGEGLTYKGDIRPRRVSFIFNIWYNIYVQLRFTRLLATCSFHFTTTKLVISSLLIRLLRFTSAYSFFLTYSKTHILVIPYVKRDVNTFGQYLYCFLAFFVIFLKSLHFCYKVFLYCPKFTTKLDIQ